MRISNWLDRLISNVPFHSGRGPSSSQPASSLVCNTLRYGRSRRRQESAGPNIEQLEERTLLTTTLFLDFGAGLGPAGQINTTVGAFSSIFGSANTGSNLVSTSRPASTPLTIAPFDFNGDSSVTAADITALQNAVVPLVQRALEPFDIQIVIGAATSLGAAATAVGANAGDATGEFDAYNFIGQITTNPNSTLFGLAALADLGAQGGNDLDEATLTFAQNVQNAFPAATPNQLAQAIAYTATHEAFHTFTYAHTPDEQSTNPQATPNERLLTSGDVIRRGSNTRLNPFIVTRFALQHGVAVNQPDNYLLAATDPDIGLRDSDSDGVPDLAYVTGTGAFDRITLTNGGGGQVDVNVTAFSDQAMTSVIRSQNYSIQLGTDTEGEILVDSSINGDEIVIDATIAAQIRVRGGSGRDASTDASAMDFDRIVFLGNGSQSGTATPIDGSGTVLSAFAGAVVTATEIESIEIEQFGDFSVVTPGAVDVVTVSSSTASGGEAALRVTGSSDAVTFLAHDLFDVGDFTLDTGLNDGGAIADTINWNVSAEPQGNVQTALRAGAGADQIMVTDIDGPTILLGQGGNDLFDVDGVTASDRLTLNGGGGPDTATVNNSNISGSTSDGLLITKTTTVSVTDSLFNNNGRDGIRITDSGDITLTRVTATGNDPGVSISGAASFSDVDGTYSNNLDHGILLVDISGNVLLEGTIADDNDADNDGTGDGFLALASSNPTAIGGTLGIFGAKFRGSDGVGGMQQDDGVSVESVTGAVSIGTILEPVVATGNDDDGISIREGSSASFGFGSFSDNGDDGIELQDFSGAIIATSVTADNNGEDGFDVDGAGSVSLTDALSAGSYSGNGMDGIEIDDVTGTVMVTSITAAGNAQQGLDVDISGDTTVDGGSFDGIRGISNSITLGNTLVTSTENVLLEALNAVDVAFGLNATASTVNIKANLDNAGTEGFGMGLLATLTTTNDTPDAVRIEVNTLLPGGAGDATLGLISAGATAGAAGGRVSVFANNGAVLDGNGILNNVSAGNTVLIGAAGVGASADVIDTSVDRIEGAGGSGGFYVENSGGLTIGIGVTGFVGIVTTTGDINVMANSPLTVVENIIGGGEIIVTATDDAVGLFDNLVVEGGAIVRSTGNNVRLNAGDDLSLEGGSLVEATSGTGRVILTGDAGNSDAAGSTITIDGIINTGLTARVRGHNDSDIIIVNAMGTGGLRLNGRGESDDYIITYPTGDTFKSTIRVEDSGAAVDTDEVTVRGTDGVDDLYFTTSGAPATAITNVVGRTGPGVERIVLHESVEFFELQSLDENDTVTAQPSMLFPTLFDGSNPCFGDPMPPTIPPGDTFIFDPLGNDITFDTDTKAINTLGGAPDPFFDTEFINFETLQIGADLPSTPLQQFDFNHTNTAASVAESPTQAGYIAVAPDTLYPGSGFGWLGNVDTFERDDSFYTGEFEKVTRDGAKLDGMQTFRIDVPEPGYHSVSVIVGDPYTDITGMSIINGDTGNVIVPSIDTVAASSTQLSFVLNVTDLTADIKFVPASDTPEIWAVNGLTIRPAELLTMGLNTCSIGPLGADGVSVDTFTLFNAPPESLITVSTTLGMIVNADEDPEIAGTQVRTDSVGQARIMVLRPSGMGTAVIRFEDVHGTAFGCSVIDYVLPDTRNFDYNDGRQLHDGIFQAVSPTQAPVATGSFPGGFLGVLGTGLYSAESGYGWLTSPNGFDDGVLLDPLGDLLRDGVSSDVAHTFQVDLPPGDYDGLVSFGDSQDHDGLTLDVNGLNKVTGVTTTATNHVQVPFEFTVASDGIAEFEFSDTAGAAYWAVNGLQIRPHADIVAFTFAPNIGAVPSDGLTIATVQATTLLDDGDEVTVSTSAGSIITADVNDVIVGIQVEVISSGITFEILAPGTPATPTLTATSLDGIHNTTVSDPALLDFTLAPTRRFDFNHTYSPDGPGPSITAAGFIGVLRTDTDPLTGHGWVTSPNSFDAGVPNGDDDGLSNAFNVLTTDLYRDYHSGHALLGSRTFRVQVDSGIAYDGTVYIGSQNFDASTRVTVEGLGVVTATDTDAKDFVAVSFTGAMDTGPDGFIDITFENAGGGSPLWATPGLDLVQQGQPLPLPSPIVAADRQSGGHVDPVDRVDIELAIDIAIAAWEDNGATGEEIALLESTPVIVRDFGRNGALGLATALGQVVIDDDGSGFGWSPILDVPTGDRYDLVTVLAHEFGHILGRADLAPVADSNELMSPYLQRGDRHDAVDGTDGFFAAAVAEFLPFA